MHSEIQLPRKVKPSKVKHLLDQDEINALIAASDSVIPYKISVKNKHYPTYTKEEAEILVMCNYDSAKVNKDK